MDKDGIKKSIELNESIKADLINKLELEHNIDEKIKILKQIKDIDSDLQYYYNILNNNLISQNPKSPIESFNNNSNNGKKNQYNFKDINRNNSKGNDKHNNKQIINEENKEYQYYDQDLDINIIYKYQSKSNNYIFYKCSKRPKCPGRAKLNLNTNQIEIITKCNSDIDHQCITYEHFFEIYKKKKFADIDFKIKKYHRYYIKALIQNNDFTDIPNAIDKFKKDTGYNILLSKQDISVIKSTFTTKYNNIDLLDLINKINNESLKIEIYSTDIKYKYQNKKNNKSEDREEKIIFFGLKDGIDLLDSEKCYEYFIDSTYKIIPKKFRPYKLMTISTILPNKNMTKICCFVCYKYQDKVSYERIITYLKENFHFLPKVVHTDYEYALYSVFDNKKIYENEVIHAFCYFHYIKAIREKVISLKISKNKLNKKAYELIKNIEIISFINRDKIKEYITFIKNQLILDEDYKKLVNYLENNWFNKKVDLFNYSKLLNFISGNKNENNNQKILEKFYATNNISESLHSKLNYYTPKAAINSEQFVSSLRKIFLDNTIKTDCIKRNDFKTRAIIKIIQDLDLNNEPQWLDFKIFYKYENQIIKNINQNLNEFEIDKIYKEINELCESNIYQNISENNEIIIDDDTKKKAHMNEDDNQIEEEDLNDFSDSISIDQEDIISKFEKFEISSIYFLSLIRDGALS